MSSGGGLDDPREGVWTRGLDVVVPLLPIAMLLFTTISKRFYMRTAHSLPLAALFMWVIRLAYFKLPSNYTNAAIIYGLLDALTPLSIIAGAITLFQAMERTKCLAWIMDRVRRLSSGHPVAEVFLIGWAFVTMIEGAAGFGTPVALAAPLLVSLGHSPVESIVCCLIMDTLSTPFGAVGTPIWFGLSGLGLEDSDLTDVALRVQLMLLAAAHIVPLIAASFLVPWRLMLRSWPFILVSLWSAALPATGLSIVTTEFPALIGGIISLGVTGLLAFFNVGLCKLSDKDRARLAERQAKQKAK